MLHLSDHAFKLKPLSLSSDLIGQLQACSTKLAELADRLQSLISKKRNKDKYYKEVNKEVPTAI